MKEIIKTNIVKLRNLCNLLEEAYKEAYGEDLYEIKEAPKKSLEQEFKQQVEKRKKKNKNEAINIISALAAAKCFRDTGFFMPREDAIKLAEKLFNYELEQGKLDELYNPKE